MSKPVTVDIPHDLTRAEARARLERGFGRLSGQLGGGFMAIEQSWEGDRLTFRTGALGRTVTGRIDVLDDGDPVPPAVGAWLVQLGGTATAFLLNGLSFVVAAVTVLPVLLTGREPARSRPASTGAWRDLGEDMAEVTANPWLWITIAIFGLINITAASPAVIPTAAQPSKSLPRNSASVSMCSTRGPS